MHLQCRRPGFGPWEDLLEKGKATHSSILAWRIPSTVHGVSKSQKRLNDFYFHFQNYVGFSGGSAGKESACNTGDPSSIPGSGRSSGEGIGYLLQYSWSGSTDKESTCNVGNLGLMGWEDPLEKGKGYPL